MTVPLPPHVQPVALPHAYRLLNHGPTVLVSAAHGDRLNVMAAAWNMPLDFSPPKVAVVLDKATLTRELIEHSGWLALNVPPVALADATFTVGSVSARDDTPATHPDKFTALQLAHWSAPASVAGTAPPDMPMQTPPLVTGCVGWLLCRLIPEPHMQQTHDLFVAEVVAAWADERVFTHGKYRPVADTPPELRTLHHMGAGLFVVPGQQVQASLLTPAPD